MQIKPNKLILRQLLTTVVLTTLVMIISACSTLEHHQIGAPYSGFDEGYGVDSNLGPSGAMGVGALFIPIGNFIYYVTYVPIDFVASSAGETLLVPIDLLFSDRYHKEKGEKRAISSNDGAYALRAYQKGGYKEEEPLISALIFDHNCSLNSYDENALNRKDKFSYTPLFYTLLDQNNSCSDALAEESNLSKLSVTPLLDANISNERLVMLIEKGLNVDHIDKNEKSLLQVSIANNKRAFVDMILPFVKDINYQNARNETALMTAIKSKQTEIALEIIEMDANLSVQDLFGYDALRYSVLFDESEVFNSLLHAGADINSLDMMYESTFLVSLDAALIGIQRDYISRQKERVFEVYIFREREKYFTSYGGYREKNERFFYVNALIENEVDTLYISPAGQNALHYARLSNNIPLLKKLIKEGVDINHKNNKGQSPFFYITHSRKYTSPRVEAALKNFKILGADINLQDENGMTALMEAAWQRRNELMRALIELGVDLEVSNHNGSAIAWAVDNRYDNIEAVKLLLDQGVSTKIQHYNGRSLISLASSYKMKRLIRSYDEGHYEFYDAAKENAYYQCIKKLKAMNYSHPGVDFYIDSCWQKVYEPRRRYSLK